MAYLVLNIVLCGVLIAYSFSIDTKKGNNRNVNPLINQILFLAALFAMMAVTLMCVFWAPKPLTAIVGKIAFVLCGWYSISMCTYAMTFPNYDKNGLLTAVQWILNIFAFGFIFLNPRCITEISVHEETGFFHIHSTPLFPNVPELAQVSLFNWFYLYLFIYLIFVPFITMLMILVRAENVEDRLSKQNIRVDAFGFATSWILFLIVVYASNFATMMFSLSFICFIPETLTMLRASRTEEIWDKRFVVRTGLKFLLRYLAPAVLIAVIWILLWPLFTSIPAVFILLVFVTLLGIEVVWQIAANQFSNVDFLRTKKYEDSFEADLSKINFEGETSEITSTLFSLFSKYADSSSMQILVDAGTGHLETVYSSTDENFQVPLDYECFETILAQKHPVVFREYAEHDYGVAIVKNSILKLMDQTHSNAFIILNEGHHILGIIFLGEKVSKNVYSEYDYEVFSKLYSNFFVIGYYLKNIVNESVIGTVNREIRMSSQIITSIQENMDHVKDPKMDVGYRMIPAHNIGGEFIDMIRLTDTRHIFIIGALNSKGIAASMNMVILKSIIRTYLAETTDFKLLVQKVNSFIRESLPKGTYFSGTFALFDFKTDTMYYINCGTPALFLYNHTYNNVIEVQGEGHILGFARDMSSYIKVKKIKLSQGDIVLVCTDGLIESTSLRGEQFSKERVQKCIMENSTYPADKMAQFEYDSLIQFTSKELENDVTVLVLKHLGGK